MRRRATPIAAALLGAMLSMPGAGAQSLPTDITIELGDIVALSGHGIASYYVTTGGPVEADVSTTARWFVISTVGLGSGSLILIAADGNETRCQIHVVPAGTLPRRAPVSDRLPVGGELRIPSGDISGYREGDSTTLDVRVSADGSEIIVVGLRPGRSALFLEHRTGRVEIRQLRVGP